MRVELLGVAKFLTLAVVRFHCSYLSITFHRVMTDNNDDHAVAVVVVAAAADDDDDDDDDTVAETKSSYCPLTDCSVTSPLIPISWS